MVVHSVSPDWNKIRTVGRWNGVPVKNGTHFWQHVCAAKIGLGLNYKGCSIMQRFFSRLCAVVAGRDVILFYSGISLVQPSLAIIQVKPDKSVGTVRTKIPVITRSLFYRENGFQCLEVRVIGNCLQLFIIFVARLSSDTFFETGDLFFKSRKGRHMKIAEIISQIL